MSTRFLARLVLTLGLLLSPTGATRLQAGEGVSSPAGSVRLSSGLTALYEYHFNRNAIRDSQLSGQTLISLTDTGNLLRFDVPSLKLTKEWYGPIPITCLGRGAHGAVLAGFADGRLCRVDLALLVPADSRLCRDGLGRLWMGGEGLFMLEASSKTLHALDTLPVLGRTPIGVLAADPAHPDGVVAALEARGLVFVRGQSSP